MTTEATTRRTGTRSKRSAALLSLLLGAMVAALVALAGAAREAEATFPGTNARIAFDSNRATGTGVDNPTGDYEIFTIRPDGTGLKQLTFNTGDDTNPVFSSDGTKIAYGSEGDQTTNPGGDYEVYLMNASDGSGKKNLTNNDNAGDGAPVFSSDGTKIAYESYGVQTSNPEGDSEVYRMNALDGSRQTNLSNTGVSAIDFSPVFSPGGKKIAYESYGVQTSNPQGDWEVYRVNALDGTGQVNLSNNGVGLDDRNPVFSPDGTKIAYEADGNRTSNPQGDSEVYLMNALDGTGKKNLTNNGVDVDDFSAAFSPGGKRIAYESVGVQTSNPQGDSEVYRVNALDGTDKKNLTNTGSGVEDYDPVFSPDGTKIAYESGGKQTSNSEGDEEIYRMNTLDGLAKKNLSNNGLDAEEEFPDWGRRAM